MTTSSETLEIVYTHEIKLYTIEKCGESEPVWNNPTTKSWKSLTKREVGSYGMSPNYKYSWPTRANINGSLPSEHSSCYKIEVVSVTESEALSENIQSEINWPTYVEYDVIEETETITEDEIVLQTFVNEYYEDSDWRQVGSFEQKISVWDCCPQKKYIDKTTGYCANFLRTSSMYHAEGDDTEECTENDPAVADISYFRNPPRCVPFCPANFKGYLTQDNFGCRNLLKLNTEIKNGVHRGSSNYSPAVIFGVNEIGNCCWPEDCTGVDDGLSTGSCSRHGASGNIYPPGVDSDGSSPNLLNHNVPHFQGDMSNFEIIDGGGGIRRKINPEFDILTANVMGGLPQSSLQYARITSQPGNLVEYNRVLEVLGERELYKISINQTDYEADWQILKIRLTGHNGKRINVDWQTIDGNDANFSSNGFETIKSSATFYENIVDWEVYKNRKAQGFYERVQGMEIKFTNNKVKLIDIKLTTTDGFNIDPLGVGCCDQSLPTWPPESPTSTSGLDDPEEPDTLIFKSISKISLASKMPLCGDGDLPVETTTTTQDESSNGACGAQIACMGPPLPPCQDACGNALAGAECENDECVDVCTDVCTGEKRDGPADESGNCIPSDPCSCPEPPPGAGCDPHISTFFNEKFEM